MDHFSERHSGYFSEDQSGLLLTLASQEGQELSLHLSLLCECHGCGEGQPPTTWRAQMAGGMLYEAPEMVSVPAASEYHCSLPQTNSFHEIFCLQKFFGAGFDSSHGGK